jgi:hypothetical protein
MPETRDDLHATLATAMLELGEALIAELCHKAVTLVYDARTAIE